MIERPFIVGITGGIGSGKSTVTNRFEEIGIPVVDNDIIARKIVQPGTECLETIKKRYGNTILTDDKLNRSALRAIMFNDIAEKNWLENLMHPVIRSKTVSMLHNAKGPYVILSSPLLFETNQDKLVDRILVIDIPENEQQLRTSKRDNIPESQVKKIVKSQIGRDQRLKRSDDIIDNSGDINNTLQQVDTLHELYIKLATKFKNEY